MSRDTIKIERCIENGKKRIDENQKSLDNTCQISSILENILLDIRKGDAMSDISGLILEEMRLFEELKKQAKENLRDISTELVEKREEIVGEQQKHEHERNKLERKKELFSRLNLSDKYEESIKSFDNYMKMAEENKKEINEMLDRIGESVLDCSSPTKTKNKIEARLHMLEMQEILEKSKERNSLDFDLMKDIIKGSEKLVSICAKEGENNGQLREYNPHTDTKTVVGVEKLETPLEAGDTNLVGFESAVMIGMSAPLLAGKKIKDFFDEKTHKK